MQPWGSQFGLDYDVLSGLTLKKELGNLQPQSSRGPVVIALLLGSDIFRRNAIARKAFPRLLRQTFLAGTHALDVGLIGLSHISISILRRRDILLPMPYVIMGLGNPGEEYKKTRHNAGRMLVELLAKNEGFDEFVLRKAAGAPSLVSEGKIKKEKVTLVLPETFMNNSGKSAKGFVKSKKVAATLLVVRDDIDLPLGVLKMTFGRGSGGHKGIESIMRAVGTKEFAQLKVGVSKPGKKNQAKKPSSDDGVNKLVIGKFKPDEEAPLKKVLKKGVEAATLFVTDGVEKATMLANTR